MPLSFKLWSQQTIQSVFVFVCIHGLASFHSTRFYWSHPTLSSNLNNTGIFAYVSLRHSALKLCSLWPLICLLSADRADEDNQYMTQTLKPRTASLQRARPKWRDCSTRHQDKAQIKWILCDTESREELISPPPFLQKKKETFVQQSDISFLSPTMGRTTSGENRNLCFCLILSFILEQKRHQVMVSANVKEQVNQIWHGNCRDSLPLGREWGSDADLWPLLIEEHGALSLSHPSASLERRTKPCSAARHGGELIVSPVILSEVTCARINDSRSLLPPRLCDLCSRPMGANKSDVTACK